MIEGDIMDVDLLIFGIKDACCKRINVGIAKLVVLKIDINWCETRGLVAVRKNQQCHRVELCIPSIKHNYYQIELKAALVKEVGTKDGVVLETLGVNDKGRSSYNTMMQLSSGKKIYVN